MLHIIPLAQFGMAYTRGWAVNSPIARIRLEAENEQLRQQLALLKEEIRTEDAIRNKPNHAGISGLLDVRGALRPLQAPSR